MALPISYTDNSRLDPVSRTSSGGDAYLDGSNWNIDFGGGSSSSASSPAWQQNPLLWFVLAIGAAIVLHRMKLA